MALNLNINTEDDYEDLLGLWSDLESGLGIVLGTPDSAQEFEMRVLQYDRWMQDLLKHDADVGLYLLFQLAINSPVGYSASHALVCAVLCQLIATDFDLPLYERDSLVHAALTMNIAMTRLQDELATQVSRPSAEQQMAIRGHAAKSAALLVKQGIADALWLETVQLHHKEDTPTEMLSMLTPPHRLAHILNVVDRYAAMISPRQSREGRSATESAKNITQTSSDQGNTVGQALVRIVGVCPPGTFVQLDGDEVAVVMRRSTQPNRPDVAIVIDSKGALIKPPQLLRTADALKSIKSALAASSVQERINHHIILQLATQTA